MRGHASFTIVDGLDVDGLNRRIEDFSVPDVDIDMKEKNDHIPSINIDFCPSDDLGPACNFDSRSEQGDASHRLGVTGEDSKDRRHLVGPSNPKGSAKRWKSNVRGI